MRIGRLLDFLGSLPPFRPPRPPKAAQVAAVAGRPNSWPLDQPMVRLTRSDCLTIREFFEGTLVLGNPGSGKTSTTGTILPMAGLRDGWGVAAFTTKPDDAAFWQRLCRETGRNRDLIFVRPDGKSRFNLIDYELGRKAEHGGSNTPKLAAILTEVFKEGRPKASRSDTNEFFEVAGQILLCNGFDGLRLAGEKVTLPNLARLVESAPRGMGDIQTEQWRAGYCFKVLSQADRTTEDGTDRRLYDAVSGYFLHTLPNMNERTIGDILATLDTGLFHLSRDPMRELLDSDQGMTFVPEMLREGAVIVIDCPVSVYGSMGRMATIAFKRIIKDYLRRRVIHGDSTRPIMFYCDECQAYISDDDAEFMQISRSQHVAPVYLTQSIDNLQSVLGSEARTDSLANALTTHFYHCTSGRTASWIERRIAQFWQTSESMGFSERNGSGAENRNSSNVHISRALYPQVLAAEFSRYRTGGPLNNGLVDCTCLKPGRKFIASGLPFVRVQWQQR